MIDLSYVRLTEIAAIGTTSRREPEFKPDAKELAEWTARNRLLALNDLSVEGYRVDALGRRYRV